MSLFHVNPGHRSTGTYRTLKFFKNPSCVCIRLYEYKVSIYYFFYTIRSRNVLWHHNRVGIASCRHGNWPITACIRHNLFYKSNRQLPLATIYFKLETVLLLLTSFRVSQIDWTQWTILSAGPTQQKTTVSKMNCKIQSYQ